MFDYILFDLDGTLTNSKEGIVNSVKYALKHFGIEENDEEKLQLFIGPPLKQQFMEQYGLDSEKALEAVKVYRERYVPIGMFENELYEGVETMLKDLSKAGKKIALASSKPIKMCEKIMEHFNVAKYFDVIVGSEDIGAKSTKTGVIEAAVEYFNLEKKQSVVMVGDRKYDIIGAKNCGLFCVGVTYGFGSYEELSSEGADHIVRSVEELEEYLI